MPITPDNTARADDFIYASEKDATPANDEGRVVKLDDNAKIDDAFLYDIEIGSGVDGDVTISTATTLTRDMYYNNLTVNSTLTTDGYRIFVKGTLSGNGTITWGTATNGTNANGATRGLGGAESGSGALKNTAGVDGAVGSTGSLRDNSPDGNNGINGRIGAENGAVGGDTFESGGLGGINQSQALPSIERWSVLSLTDIGGVFRKLAGSGSGAGGGTSITGGGSGAVNAGGGGSGSTGGVVFICANVWAGTFTIRSRGGNGGNGGNSSHSSVGIRGGGGGGGGTGGVAYVIYRTKTWTGDFELEGGTGGIGGNGANGGGSGSNGGTQNGVSYEISFDALI